MTIENFSVDRIDSQKHYKKDNVQIVLYEINAMKMDFPQEEFIQLCREVIAYAENKT